jgi:hypothetical protein
MADAPPGGVMISSFELKTDDRWREQLAAGVRCAAVNECTVYVELSHAAVEAGGVNDLLGTPARLKYRTGGVDQTARPSAKQLATVITMASGGDVAFKLTAGLHQAVRHTGAATGFLHHGFLNIGVATAAALEGAEGDVVARLLAADDADAIRAAYLGTTNGWRTRFVSFGTCSIAEPVESLVELGLLDQTILVTRTGGHL